MFAHLAALTLLLSSPGLVAPPPARDLERMSKTIEAAHPDHTPAAELAPVSTLLEVAEEARRALEHAPTGDLQRLMHYAHAARMTAYTRTGDPTHACASIADSDRLLARDDVPDDVVKQANQARDEATTVCASGTRTPVDVPRNVDRLSGGVLLTFAALATVTSGAAAGLAVTTKNELREDVRDLQAKGYRTSSDDALLDVERDAFKVFRATAIVSGISAAVLWGFGAWILRGSGPAKQPRRVSVSPFGGLRGAGLVLSGRF